MLQLFGMHKLGREKKIPIKHFERKAIEYTLIQLQFTLLTHVKDVDSNAGDSRSTNEGVYLSYTNRSR